MKKYGRLRSEVSVVNKEKLSEACLLGSFSESLLLLG